MTGGVRVPGTRCTSSNSRETSLPGSSAPLISIRSSPSATAAVKGRYRDGYGLRPPTGVTTRSKSTSSAKETRATGTPPQQFRALIPSTSVYWLPGMSPVRY